MTIAVAGLWIAYLVPHHLRYRQQLLEARAEDRFSEHLRVLRVAQVPGPVVVQTVASGPVRLHISPQVHHQGGRAMERPHGTRDRIAADLARRSAAEHSQRAAHLARRAAGARRRAALTAVLLLAVVGGWTAVAAGAAILLGAVPSALLLGVLGLGRRAVVAGARADAAWAAGAVTRLPAARRAGAVGRAVRPSDAVTEVMARVPRSPALGRAAGAAEATAAPASVDQRGAVATTSTVHDEPETGPAWAPVPVPRPTYTLKPAARRAEPAPLTEATLAPAAAATTDATTDAERDEVAEVHQPVTGGLDLDAVLARRRAVGA